MKTLTQVTVNIINGRKFLNAKKLQCYGISKLGKCNQTDRGESERFLIEERLDFAG